MLGIADMALSNRITTLSNFNEMKFEGVYFALGSSNTLLTNNITSLSNAANSRIVALSNQLSNFALSSTVVTLSNSLSNYALSSSVVTLSNSLSNYAPILAVAQSNASLSSSITTLSNAFVSLSNSVPGAVPDASTSVKGKVQLSDAVNLVSSVLAATPSAVKTVNDLLPNYLPKAGGTMTGSLTVDVAAGTPTITNPVVSRLVEIDRDTVVRNPQGAARLHIVRNDTTKFSTIAFCRGGNTITQGEALIEVSGTSNMNFYLNTNTLGTFGPPKMTITTGSNVGINTSNPVCALDVNGTIRATSWSNLPNFAMSNTVTTLSNDVVSALSSKANSSSLASYLTTANASSTYFTKTGGTLSGNLVMNGRLCIQDGMNGTNARGIFMWDVDTTSWGIYIANNDANKSLNNITPGVGAAFGSHALRFRVNDAVSNGFIFENSSEQVAASIRGDGLSYFAGNVGIGTKNPSVKLHVVGDVLSSSSIRAVNGFVSDSGSKIYMNSTTPSPPGVGVLGSSGTRLVLWPGVDGASSPFALGVDNDTLWYAVSGGCNHKWYIGSGDPYMVLSTGGRLGINTTNPTQRLDVNGVIASRMVPANVNNPEVGTQIMMYPNYKSAGRDNRAVSYIKSGCAFETGGGFDHGKMILGTRTSDGITPTNHDTISMINGSVGIGTTDPQVKFHVNGGSVKLPGGEIGLGGGDTYVKGKLLAESQVAIGTYYNVPDWKLQVSGTIRTDAFSMGGVNDFGIDAPGIGNGRFVVKENGNMGIGKTNPLYKLDVDGWINAGTVVANNANISDTVVCGTLNATNLNVTNFSPPLPGGATLLDDNIKFIKFPSNVLTANLSATQDGAWLVSASSWPANYEPYRLFNPGATPKWNTDEVNYYTNGVWNGNGNNNINYISVVDNVEVRGAWVQLEVYGGSGRVVNRFGIQGQPGTQSDRMPKSFVLAGSTDGDFFAKILEVTDYSFPLIAESYMTYFDMPNNKTRYTHFRLIAKSLQRGVLFGLGAWELFGPAGLMLHPTSAPALIHKVFEVPAFGYDSVLMPPESLVNASTLMGSGTYQAFDINQIVDSWEVFRQLNQAVRSTTGSYNGSTGEYAGNASVSYIDKDGVTRNTFGVAWGITLPKYFCLSRLKFTAQLINGTTDLSQRFPRKMTILGSTGYGSYHLIDTATFDWSGGLTTSNIEKVTAMRHGKKYKTFVFVVNLIQGGGTSSPVLCTIPSFLQMYGAEPGVYFSVDSQGGLVAGNQVVGESNYGFAKIINGTVNYTGALNFLSDRRLKSDIVDANLDEIYDGVKAMKVRKFTKAGKTDIVGVIADELESVDPKLIGEIDGYQNVELDGIVMRLLGAVKKLQDKVDQLENKPATRSRRKKCPT
jgi:hypothetical protein